MDKLNQTLTEWGRSQRVNPTNGAELKAKILAKASTMPKKQPAWWNFRLPQYLLSGAAVLVLGLMIFQNNTLPKRQNVQTEFSSGSDVPPMAADAGNLAGNTEPAEQPNFKASPEVSRSMGALPNNQAGLNIAQTEPTPLYYKIDQPIPASDSREFLKIYYSAQIQNRRVEETSDKIKNLLAGLDGRIDSYSTNTERARISFVMPAKHLESFKEQLKTLAGKRFYIESTDAQNLLPQKQQLESQTKFAQDSYQEMQSQKAELAKRHEQALAGFNSQIAALTTQLNQAEKDWQSNQLNADLINKIDSLKIQIGKLKASLAQENTSYKEHLNWFDQEAENINQNIENLKKQDQDLMDNVATVNGTIYIYRINTLEYINAYLPFYLSVPFVLILILLWLVTKRHRTLKVP